MIGYIASKYPVAAIDVPEAAYRHTSFGPGDLASYRQATGRTAWPRDWRGRVNVDDPSVWEWKSSLMEKFVERAATAGHRHGKPLDRDRAARFKGLRHDGKDPAHGDAALQLLAQRLGGRRH